MSMFTQFNGPNSVIGPSAKDMTSLIDAYNNLATKLTAHIEAVAPTDTTIHGIVAYVKDIKAQLENIIGTKASIQSLDEVRTTATAAATRQALSEATQQLQERINTKADSSMLDTKTDKVTTTNLSRELSLLTETVTQLQIEWRKYIGHVTDTDTKLAFNTIIESAKYILGTLHVIKVIDFTRWAHFSAPFAGTGGISDTSTNGAFLLGCLSLDWTDDQNVPDKQYAHKSGRAYIKYVNTSPFDAVCDMTVTKTDEGYKGTLSVHVSKKENTWEEMAFHLLLGTDSKGTECVYLAISAKGLAVTNAQYSNTNFRACGENFIPVNEPGYFMPSGLLHGISTAYIGALTNGTVSFSSVTANEFTASKSRYYDEYGYSLLSLITHIDPDDNTIYKQLMIGDARHNDITLAKRPSMFMQNNEGDLVKSYFITTQDIKEMFMPIGAIIRWAPVDDEGNLKNIPEGFLACDHSKVSNADYPELCELLGVDELGMATLPNEQHSIIRAKVATAKESTSLPEYEEIAELNAISQRLSKEVERAKVTESGLSNRIDVNKDAITAEVERATAAEQQFFGKVEAETERATAQEQTLQSNIEAETERATAQEQTLQGNIETETARATKAESDNTEAIAAETSRAIKAEDELSKRIDVYADMETRLQDNIDAEADRAKAEEQSIKTQLSEETERSTNKDTYLEGRLDSEITRATNKDAELTSKLDAEIARAKLAEQQESQQRITQDTEILNNATNEVKRASAAEKAINERIDRLHPNGV